MTPHHLIGIDEYEPLVGAATVERIRAKARRLQGRRVAHVNATYYGGGVAEMLSSLTLVMNRLDIPTEWRVLRGTPEFFGVTKAFHNALQGAETDLAALPLESYEQVIDENALRTHLNHDFVIVHDPQPLPLIGHRRRGRWIWRCHIDLSDPEQYTWDYLVPFIQRYHAVILSCPEYEQRLTSPQVCFLPAIDPFSPKHRALSEPEIDACLERYAIPTDRPLVVQVSRFDPWKDPEGVIAAFKLARRAVDATLVLLGNFAADDPEGGAMYERLMASREERILVLPHGDDVTLVNSLQRRAAVVLQKSLREGFGLTVTEAMWKGRPVIGGNVGGIRYQIEDGVNGFLVSSIEETAERLVHLLTDEVLRRRLGQAAHETVRERFLLSRYLEQYLDLFGIFEGRPSHQRIAERFGRIRQRDLGAPAPAR
jgi:trehalose synthase